MEKERREPGDERAEKIVEIPEQNQEILRVDTESAREREIVEQQEAKNLREQVREAFTDKEESVPVNNLEERIADVKDISVVKKMGIWTGKKMEWFFNLLKARAAKFNIETLGADNLKELEGKPYILAANHIKPKNILMQMIGLSPDSSIIKRVVQEETSRTPNAIANVSSKIRRIPIIGGYLDRIWSPFREGMMEGAGFIPVKMRRGGEQSGFNRNFIEHFRDAVDKKEPVIIFPQGQWDKKFNPEREFETGTSTLSSRYGLPIVPVYIDGGRSWFSKEKVSVSMGQVINPEGKSKDEIIEDIRISIADMQKAKEK